MNGDQLQQTWFWPPKLEQKGYVVRDVDELVNVITAELDAGRPAGPPIEEATPGQRIWGRRYDIDAVDWLVGQFRLRLGPFGPAGTGDDPWLNAREAFAASAGSGDHPAALAAVP